MLAYKNIKTSGSLVVFFTIWVLVLGSCNYETFDNKMNRAVQQKTSQINWMGHWYGEGKRQELVEEIATEFEFRNQEIKVNLYYVKDIIKGDPNNQTLADSEMFEVMAKEITSANPKYDIIRLKNNYYDIAAKLNDLDWGKKYLVDFSERPDFVKNHKSFLISDEYKSDYGGISPGPYNEGFYFAVWFNKELADKIGLKIKQYGMTANDFKSYVEAVVEYNKKNNTDIIPIFEEQGWITLENIMATLFFSEINDTKELLNGKPSQQKLDALEKVLKYFEELAQYNPVPKNRKEIFWAQTFDYPLNGKCLLYLQGSWMYNIWENIDGALLKKMYPAELPSFTGSNTNYIGGYKPCWAVLKNAPNREQAVKFMEYWSRPEVAEKWVRYTKCPTGLKGNLTQSTIGFDQFEDFEFNISLKYNQKMIDFTDKRYMLGMVNRHILIPVIDIVEKRKTANQVMAEIKRQLKY